MSAKQKCVGSTFLPGWMPMSQPQQQPFFVSPLFIVAILTHQICGMLPKVVTLTMNCLWSFREPGVLAKQMWT